MNKYLGQTITFIPEVYKNGYLVGHTGNYLLIKYEGSDKLLHTDVTAIADKIDYPYLICK